MKGKHLAYYEECMKAGQLRHFSGVANGLCYCGLVDQHILADYFEPTNGELSTLASEDLCEVWWASGLHKDTDTHILQSAFTPLRQTIVLFMAAINGEL